jgi:hypothetical protein
MTNWEKFKEVFGIPADIGIEPMRNMCSIVDCKGIECDDCFIYKNNMQGTSFWRREYKKKERNNMTYELNAEMHLEKIIGESREVSQALNEFADKLEEIEKKYADNAESEEK